MIKACLAPGPIADAQLQCSPRESRDFGCGGDLPDRVVVIIADVKIVGRVRHDAVRPVEFCGSSGTVICSGAAGDPGERRHHRCRRDFAYYVKAIVANEQIALAVSRKAERSTRQASEISKGVLDLAGSSQRQAA